MFLKRIKTVSYGKDTVTVINQRPKDVIHKDKDIFLRKDIARDAVLQTHELLRKDSG